MLDGSAHAQVLFETPQGDRLLREITPAVAQAFPPVGDGHAVDVGGPRPARYNRGSRLAIMRALLTLTVFATLAPQAPDPAMIARWAKASVVHYRMIGVYEGATVIADGEPAGTATVTDRVELELDWDLKAGALVGTATFVNGDSHVGDLRNIDRSCPAPTPEGSYEHITVASVRGANGSLELNGTRAFPSVRVVAGCLGVQEPRTVPAWRRDVVERLVVPSPLLVAAPAGSDPNLTVSADRTSFTIANGAWTWTFMPTLVR